MALEVFLIESFELRQHFVIDTNFSDWKKTIYIKK